MAISRRGFILGTAVVGGGLLVGMNLRDDSVPYPAKIKGSYNPNAWLQITPEGRYVVQMHKAEMGQGVVESLPTILAEELDIDPDRLEVQYSGIHPDFSDPSNGGQMTGGSSSIRNSYQVLREAGAAARATLVAAAAQRWGVDPASCTTENALITGPDGQQLAYHEVASAAAELDDVPFALKAEQDFRYIGASRDRRDARAKSTGQQDYGVDVDLPGIVVAIVVRCPHFGGSVASWDRDSVAGDKGIREVFEIHSGIAIVADSYWQARKAAGKLIVEWDKGPLAELDSAAIVAQQRALFDTEKPRTAMEAGDIEASLANAAQTLSAEYSAPFTHHSPMEPQNATALVHIDRMGKWTLEMWVPSQAPDLSRAVAAHFSRFGKDDITVHSTQMGGGFGRRGYPDFAGEVAAISEKFPGVPVKLMWSREDDMQHDYYRASSEHRLSAALDSEGNIDGWQHTMVASSIIKTMAVSMASQLLPSWVPRKIAESMGRFGGKMLAGVDPIPAEGAKPFYNFDNVLVGNIEYDSGVPGGFWRSVGYSYNVFALECFLDECAHAAGADPYEYRLRYLPGDSRLRTVLELAAEKASWGKPADGLTQGIALSDPFQSFCAMVVEARVDGNNYSIERVVAAVDCGRVINPDIVKAQVEGGIIYAMSAAMKEPVTIKEGAVEQSNFHDLPVIRIHEAPRSIEVHLVDSTEAPTGIGEIAVPALAPALGNALFAATGQRLRSMPLKLA